MFFWRKKSQAQAAEAIHGVNLGGWLMLEKWITPSLFKGSFAEDEYSFCDTVISDELDRLDRHRKTFITRADFKWLKSQGVTALRLPVNTGVFGDEPPYVGAIEYVDKAFDWADSLGLKILLDIHGAPGSQNGGQESGRVGDIRWHKNEDNIIATLMVIEQLARRYKDRKSLLGIELLNEPHRSIPQPKLLKFYTAGYRLVRDICGDDVWVVFSDGFQPDKWKRKLKQRKYKNMYLDSHQYQAYSLPDKLLDIAGHVNKTFGKVGKQLKQLQNHHPVIIGEWSLALDKRSTEGLTPLQLEAARRAYAAAQLIVFERTAGWFYWTYKTEEGGVWSFRDCIEKCWLPPLKLHRHK